ncbi:hypothetical protein OG21DRAFT_1427450 [Imleria badia]|nr:hypothetical protein OG21DRAFT_1427450 [Imleria badia]
MKIDADFGLFQVPCENCFKRGCGSICPTGSLTTGKGNRLILTSTAELHDKIESMSARIRELEEALAKKSDDPHRLLSGDNSLVSRGSMEKTSSYSPHGGAPSTSEPETDSFIDAFGTLTIGTRGETSFMSSTARTERPLRKAPTWATLVQNSRLPPRVINASMLEHDVTPVDNELRELVMGYRPPLSEAIRLCEVYLDWAKTLWTPVSRHELLDEIIGSVYRADWTYTLAGLGVKLAYRVNLHSARFRLEKSVAQKRNTVFWQMFLMDTMLSFYAGRPPNVSLDWIDAPYPEDEFPLKNDNEELEMGWRSWSWRFSKLLHEVLVAAFGAKIPTYSTILELDRKIRDFPVPSHLQLQCVRDTRAGSQVILQQVLVLTMKESVLLNIHRRYFSQSLQDSASDPLKHKYGPSVMAIYRSAWRLIVSHTSAVDRISDIAARLPIIWSQALSAAIVMCMIVTRAPSSNMAASSLHEIDVVYEIFKKAAPTTRIASNLMACSLEHIEKVWRKSHQNQPRSDCILSRAELDRVGGGSTSIISKAPSSCPSRASSLDPSASYSNPSNVTNPPCPSKFAFDVSSSNIHPRIMEDLQSFDGFQASSTATGGPDYAPPEQFSQTMIDTQFSQFVEAEASKAQEALNMFYPAQPQPFLPPSEVHSIEGIALDPAWQSFMEQLGF